MGSRHIVSFDWAIKNILRDKANYVILEGFLSALLKREIIIQDLIESESNQNYKYMKFNHVDVLAVDKNGEHLIIEVQYAPEQSFFKRILFSTSKDIVDNLKLGADYKYVKKVYSVNIIYFDISDQHENLISSDYIYHGQVNFTGYHNNKPIAINPKYIVGYDKIDKSDINIFPEYFIIPVSIFNDEVKDDLDEWLYSLKNNEVKDEFKSPGIEEMGKKLEFVSMPKKKQLAYEKYQADLASERGVLEFNALKARHEGKIEGELLGVKKGKIETAKILKHQGVMIEIIIKSTGLSKEEIDKL